MSVNLIPLDDIEVPDKRQRTVVKPNKVMELIDSISKPAIGLMHPIVYREEAGKKILVAGLNRQTAFRDAHELGIIMWFQQKVVPPGHVPAIALGELDPIDAWEAELEENIRRDDLSWPEAARATAELLEMRAKKAVRDNLTAPTIATIAEEKQQDRATTRAEILVAPHLDDPEVSGAPNLEKALKVLKRREERNRNFVMAEKLGKVMNASSHTLINAKTEDFVADEPEGKYAVILTDPPYGMGADSFGDRGGRTMGAHGYEDTPENFRHILSWLPEQSFRVAANHAHLYLFCDLDWFAELKVRFADAGWRVFRTPIIWHKPAGWLTPWVEQGPQRRYETILYAIKGERKVQRIAGDVISMGPDENLDHAAQKPVALFRELLSRSVIPGDRVLDLFAGTGPIFPAAHELKCLATGVEIDAVSYAKAAKRVEALG